MRGKLFGGVFVVRVLGCIVVFCFLCFASQAASPPPIAAYGSQEALDGPTLSPDGTKVAFISSITGRRCIHVHVFSEAKPRSIICAQAPEEFRWVRWKSNSRLIASLYGIEPGRIANETGPISYTHLAALDDDGANKLDLVRARQGFVINFEQSNITDMLPDDPDHILVQLFRENTTNPDVMRVNVNTGENEIFQKEDGDIRWWWTDQRGHVLFGAGIKDGKAALYYRSSADASFEPLPPLNFFGSPILLPAALGDKPDTVYAMSNAETGLTSIYLFDLRQRRVLDRIASDSRNDIASAIVEHGRFVGYGYIDDQPEQVFVDPAWQHDLSVIGKALPGTHVEIVDRTSDGKRVLAKATTGADAGELYLLTREAGKNSALTPVGPYNPYVPEEWVAPVKSIDYTSRDGLTIHAYVTLPPGPAPKGPIPFIVMPHGGPWARDYYHFDYIAQMLASRGYGVLQPNFRGSTGYGKAFLSTGFHEWGQHMQDDITDGTRWLVTQKYADPTRICIVGWSYGGYAALMGAIKEPDLYRCVASMAGVTDLRRVYSRGNGRIVESNNPALEGDISHLEENSPRLQAAKIKIPVLLLHGALDRNVPIQDTKVMEEALRNENKQVEAVYFPDEDHYLFRGVNRITFLTKLESFVEANLGPGAPVTPGAPQ